MFRLKIKPI